MSELQILSANLEYASYDDIRQSVATLIRPPRRMKVSDAAKEYLKVKLPSGSYDAWDPELTPYLIEPMDCLVDRRYQSVVLVGPARSGKTVFLLAWMAYDITCDPSDMMIIHTTKDMARKFSRMDLDRAIKNSPELASRLSTRASDDNIFDKTFKSGNMLSVTYPTITQISSLSIKRIAASDYDRQNKDDVSGEGDFFGNMNKRTETFMSSGTSAIETSPGFPITDSKWRPTTEHEAPPCEGALGFYNMGDRRRFYWQCKSCKEWFRAESEYLKYEENDDLEKSAKTAKIQCPHCKKSMGRTMRRNLNIKGRWLKEGQTIDKKGEIHGTGRESSIASFWYQGPVACFQTWASQTLAYLRAEKKYEDSGSEEMLRRTITQDQGRPYLAKAREKDRSYIDLMDRAEDIGFRVVPKGVRFLTVSIDVQGDYYVVQVEGWGIGLEHWYIDRYKITKSTRVDVDGIPYRLDPGAYTEDWDILIDDVLKKSYPLGDGSGRRMKPRWVSCDSGGKSGVTREAYRFYRRLKRHGLTANFMLVKGEKSGPRVKKSFPDSQRKDRRAGARGEIPVYFVNANLIKDNIDHSLSNIISGPGCSHFPDWFEESWYKELLSEVKEGDRWVNRTNKRNEAVDCTVYNRANLLVCKGEQINWDKPPRWAEKWDRNTLVFNPDDSNDDSESVPKKDMKKSMKDIGRRMAGG